MNYNTNNQKMKYGLYVNQQQAIELGIKNIQEAHIFDLLTTAAIWAEPEIINNEVYYWVARQKIKELLPLLNLKEDTIYRYLKRLKEIGLIEYIKKGKKDLIKITQKGKKYLVKNEQNTMSEKNPSFEENTMSENFPKNDDLLCRKKIRKNSEKNPTYSTINDSKYIKEKNIKKEKSEEKQTTKQEDKQQPSPISKKETNEKEKTNNTQITIQTLIEIIKEFFLKEKINFSYAKRVLFENKLKELRRNYQFKEIKEVIEFAKDDLFYKKLLPNPKSFFNSFESIKVAMQAEKKNRQAYKDNQPEYVIDFYSLQLPEGYVL